VIAPAAAVIRTAARAAAVDGDAPGALQRPVKPPRIKFFRANVSPMQHFVTPRAWREVAVWQIHINRRHH
jgi:hypothetical protein